jgi:hypothetical protein
MDSFLDFTGVLMRTSSKSQDSPYRFPDKRINKRFLNLLEALTNNPTASIPEACANSASTKAAYRFLDSDSFETSTIDDGMYQETIDRLDGRSLVLIAQDTTTLNFSTHPHTEGLGYIDRKHTRGMLMHSAFAISEKGLPLGVIHRKLWVRPESEYGKKSQRKKKPTEEKESYRWQETEAFVEKRIPTMIHKVMIGDRESDLFDYIARPREINMDMVIRVAHNRRLLNQSEHQRLFDCLVAAPIQARAQIPLTDHKTGATRVAQLCYRWKTVTLNSPLHGMSSQKEPVCVNMIVVREEQAPGGVTPVEWKLMTTIEMRTFEDVQRIVRWYSYRWLIERFHYVLKSGCTVEKLQMEELSRLERAIVLYMIVAWKLLYMTYKARIEPDASATEILFPHEWEALYCTVHKTKQVPANPPTIVEAVSMIAKLGGFMGRNRDGSPGVKVLWRGYKRLIDIAETYRFFVYEEKKDVGNG